VSNLKSLTKKKKAAESASDFINEADQASQKTPKKNKEKRLNVEIPEDLHKQLKRAALDQDCSVRELVIQGIEKVL
jgi:predicted HicB family RNase H-like nuclease